MDTAPEVIEYKPFLLYPKKKVTVSHDFLSIESSPEHIKIMNARAFNAYKYGIKWIHFILPFGLKFAIKLKDQSGKIFTIRMFSLFGINKDYCLKKLTAIHTSIWEKFMSEKCESMILRILEGESIILNNIEINKHQLSIIKKNRKVKNFFTNEIELLEYREKCTLINKNTREIIKDFNYLEDWNSGLIYSILKSIRNMP